MSRPKIYLVNCTDDKVNITTEELNVLLDDFYYRGYYDGFADGERSGKLRVDAAQPNKKHTKVTTYDLDRGSDPFLNAIYTDVLNSWKRAHKDETDNNIIPYEIQEINPNKER